jgi:A/G-specific adenine glycosylase
MDLGATICTPRNPLCDRCPLAGDCKGLAQGITATLPRKSPKPGRPTRYGVAFWAVRPDGAVLLRRREERGLLGGMMEVPSTPWRERRWGPTEAMAAAPITADWQALDGVVEHGFTHFALEFVIYTAMVPRVTKAEGIWCRPDDFGTQALPTAMKKICRHALAAARQPQLKLRRARS